MTVYAIEARTGSPGSRFILPRNTWQAVTHIDRGDRRHATRLKRIVGFSGQAPPLSPSAHQASLQTSTVHASNRPTGVAMSLIRNDESNVKKHFSSHGEKHLHLVRAATEPDATGFSGDDLASAAPNALDSASQSPARIPTLVDSDSLGALAVPPKPQA